MQVVIKDETIWCTQKAMAQLFGVNKSGISRHISNIFKEGELHQDTTVAKIATVVNRGIRGEVQELVDFYNLDMIIAVGYRVSSPKATRFRQWATKILNEYIKKGFVMDDERLKQCKLRKRLKVNMIFSTRHNVSTLTSISKSKGCWGI